MAKGRGKGTKDEGRYIITQANLDKKGKTNKKTKRNPLALKYLSVKGKELKEAGEALAREAKNKKKNVTAQS
jgi:hypothetical protein